LLSTWTGKFYLQVVSDMGKNIVIFCDGTGNSYQNTETNVLRLYNLAVKDPERQIACYNPGVGTFPHPLVTPQRRVRRILELTLGLGLMDDVAKLYKILMRQYEPDDTIFLFGFSRGAFTVRALAALIHVCGLLKAEDVHLLPHAVELYCPTRSSCFGRQRLVSRRRRRSRGLTRSQLSTITQLLTI
jgi:uncharacterized protein (DUF2235 family)